MSNSLPQIARTNSTVQTANHAKTNPKWSFAKGNGVFEIPRWIIRGGQVMGYVLAIALTAPLWPIGWLMHLAAWIEPDVKPDSVN